jgi:hypothetical protein
MRTPPPKRSPIWHRRIVVVVHAGVITQVERPPTSSPRILRVTLDTGVRVYVPTRLLDVARAQHEPLTLLIFVERGALGRTTWVGSADEIETACSTGMITSGEAAAAEHAAAVPAPLSDEAMVSLFVEAEQAFGDVGSYASEHLTQVQVAVLRELGLSRALFAARFGLEFGDWWRRRRKRLAPAEDIIRQLGDTRVEEIAAVVLRAISAEHRSKGADRLTQMALDVRWGEEALSQLKADPVDRQRPLFEGRLRTVGLATVAVTGVGAILAFVQRDGVVYDIGSAVLSLGSLSLITLFVAALVLAGWRRLQL